MLCFCDLYFVLHDYQKAGDKPKVSLDKNWLRHRCYSTKGKSAPLARTLAFGAVTTVHKTLHIYFTTSTYSADSSEFFYFLFFIFCQMSMCICLRLPVLILSVDSHQRPSNFDWK